MKTIYHERKNNVAFYRQMIKLTQKELAERIGVNRTTILAIENEESEPKLRTARMLSIALHQPIDTLFPYFFEHYKEKEVKISEYRYTRTN